MALSELSCPLSVKMCQLVSVCCVGTLTLLSDGFEIKKKKSRVLSALVCSVLGVGRSMSLGFGVAFGVVFELPDRKDRAVV